jgi:hypothetical protein
MSEMSEEYHVQQRGQRGGRWITLAVYESRPAAAAGAADVTRGLRQSKYETTTDVRVVGTSELARETVLGRAAAEMLRRANRVR